MSRIASHVAVVGNLVLNNWKLKLVALLLGSASFYAIRGVTGIEMQHNVPVQVKVEKGIAVLDQNPRSVEVTFRGSREDLRGQIFEDIRAVLRPKVGTVEGPLRVPVGPGNIEGAFRATPVSVRPTFVTITFDREGQKLVTVDEPQIIGRPLLGRVRLTYEPRHVTVRGPRSRLEEIVSLPTEPVDVEGRVESFTQNLRILVPTDKGILEVRPPEVRARIEIVVEMSRREFTDMPVLAAVPAGFSSRIVVEPPTVRLILRGRAEVVEGLSPDAVNVFVAYPGTGNVASAELPVRVSLPLGIEVGTEVLPPTVLVRLEENIKR